MCIRNVNTSFINIKACDKYDASSVKEQIKTYFNDGGGGGGRENTKTSHNHDHFGGEKIQKLYLHGHFFVFFFFWGGGGGGGGRRKEKDRVMGRNKVLSFLLQKNGRENDWLLGSFS